MTKIELCNLLIKNAKEYIKSDVLNSITRNHHMNNYGGEHVKDETIDAILVDFINYVAAFQGVDLGLYTKDLEDDEIENRD